MSVHVCSCGHAVDAAGWEALPLVGHQDDGAGGLLELRNCVCRSTGAIEMGVWPNDDRDTSNVGAA